MLRVYKEPELNKLYQGLLGKTPDEVAEMKIWGSILFAFTRGYEGLERPKYIPFRTPAHVAYMAGRDTAEGQH